MQSPTSTRAGRLVGQPTGYQAFIPAALPPEGPSVRIDPEMQVLLSDADRFLGRLDGSIQTLPDPNLFVMMYVRKEAVLSSQIEGTQSSLRDVLEAEAMIRDPARPDDAAEVINYVKATNHGLERLEALPVSVRLLKELHAILLQGVRGSERSVGEFRTSQNWIGPQGCTLRDAAFVPPPAHEMLDALSNLEKFIHSDSGLPLLIHIGITHAQFETIHPFLDGNGRLGRLLITLLLCEREVLLEPVLYLSHYLRQHREAYYLHLQNVRFKGDWEAWLKFFLKGVAEVSREATELARDIVELREGNRQVVNEAFGRTAANAHRVLESLYSKPVISVTFVKELTRLSYPAANQLVERFVRHGVLQEITGRTRNRMYAYAKYIQLFS